MEQFEQVRRDRDREGLSIRGPRRRVDSVRCLFVRGRWNALAYDLDRVDWRVFRLDRMREVVSDGPAARRDPPADDLATWLRTDFGRAKIGPD